MTHGGLEPLQERLCVRPTSETLFCDFLCRGYPPLPGSSQGIQPVVLRCEMGEDHKTPSSAPESSYGRRATLPTPQPRKRKSAPSRC